MGHPHSCDKDLGWGGGYDTHKSGSKKNAQRNSTEEVGLRLKGEMLLRQDEGTVLGKGVVLK